MKLIRIAICGTLLFALSSGMAACTKSGVQSAQLAATVNGAPIYESKVEEYVNMIRENNTQNNKDDEWEEWLESSGYTQESIRKLVIDSFIDDELIRQAAGAAGIRLDAEAINEQIDDIRAHYDSNDAWKNALESSGYTEDEYKSAIELSYLSAKLEETQIALPTPTEAERQEYYDNYASIYAGKKSSYILISSDDEERAKELCKKLKLSTNLAVDFAAAAKRESIDPKTAAEGGNVGWSSLGSLPAVYITALDALAVGQMTTAPVMSDYGYYLIYCTDQFMPDDEEIDFASVPAEIASKLDSALVSQLKTQAFKDYLASLRNKAKIVLYTASGETTQ